MDKIDKILSIIKVLPVMVNNVPYKVGDIKFSKTELMILRNIYTNSDICRVLTFREFKKMVKKYSKEFMIGPFTFALSLKKQFMKRGSNN